MGLTGRTLEWRAGELWSGGNYGPEGGIPTTLVVVALFFVLQRIPLERQPLPLLLNQADGDEEVTEA